MVYNGAAVDVAAVAARGVKASTKASRTVAIPVATAVDADAGGFGEAALKALTVLKTKND